MNTQTSTTHMHFCVKCRSTRPCDDTRHSDVGTTSMLCDGCEGPRSQVYKCERCEGIFFKYTLADGEEWCEDNRLPNGDTQCADCSDSLKRELERFALLIDAIRDLLRWIDVVRVLDAYHMHTVCFIGDIPNPAELVDVRARAAARGLLPVELTQAELDRVTQAKELERIFSAIEGHLELFEALGEE